MKRHKKRLTRRQAKVSPKSMFIQEDYNMFDYDTAMADPECHIFVNVHIPNDEDNPENMEGWVEDE